MRIVEPSAFILYPIDGEEMLKRIERIGRVAWKSEDKAEEGSAPRFVDMLIKAGHESVLEHESITVKFVVDRGISHELVRHRIASFTQESTRYCDYTKGEVTFVRPLLDEMEMRTWEEAMRCAEWAYKTLRAKGVSAQHARTVLPTSTKTEVIVTANLREWRHIFRLRTALASHPQMRQVMEPLLQEFKNEVPVVFDDL